jgi:hypothetical protein
MDWKSTVVISGAGILATWFFSMPPTQTPPATVAPARRAVAARSTTSKIDIAKEAERLQSRPRPDARYNEPSRNPFRFSERREPALATSGAHAAPPPVAVALPPPPPAITLDGIASDNGDGQQQRTAILHTDAGVVLAKEGDVVAGYRVATIGADAVELMKVDDGSSLRLGLR